MYRHVYILTNTRIVPHDHPGVVDALELIRKHHVEASGDDFNELHIYQSLPAAAKLNYKHDFPGMYNHISQVQINVQVRLV